MRPLRRRTLLVLAPIAGFGALHLFPAGWDLLYAAHAERIALGGTVTAIAGPAPVAAGARCEVVVDPDFKAGFDCRVDVACGGRAIWGGPLGGGYADCATRAHRFLGGANREPDRVWLAFDLARAELGVADERWQVRVALDPK